MPPPAGATAAACMSHGHASAFAHLALHQEMPDSIGFRCRNPRLWRVVLAVGWQLCGMAAQATSRRWSRQSWSMARTLCASRLQMQATPWTMLTSSTRPPTVPSCASLRRWVPSLRDMLLCLLHLPALTAWSRGSRRTSPCLCRKYCHSGLVTRHETSCQRCRGHCIPELLACGLAQPWFGLHPVGLS